jgi:hypothetical protein
LDEHGMSFPAALVESDSDPAQAAPTPSPAQQSRHLRHLRHLAEDATNRAERRERAAMLAELQYATGLALRDLVVELRADGLSWRELARDLGVAPTTLHGQYRTGRSIVLPPHDGEGRGTYDDCPQCAD